MFPPPHPYRNLVSDTDVDCSFFINRITNTCYIKIYSDEVVTGKGLLEITANEYIREDDNR